MSLDNKQIAFAMQQVKELFSKGFIDEKQQTKILEYYKELKPASSANRALVALGVLAAFLVGAGIILIFAYNWSDFSKTLRAFLSFMPLLLAQGFAFYVLWTSRKKTNSLNNTNFYKVWSEPAAVFWILSVGASISLVTQTYHISGDLPGFFLAWSLATIPVLFLFFSVFAFVSYLILLASYTGATFVSSATSVPWTFWLLLVVAVVFYVLYFYRYYFLHNEHSQKLSTLKKEIMASVFAISILVFVPLHLHYKWFFKYEGFSIVLLLLSMFSFLFFVSLYSLNNAEDNNQETQNFLSNFARFFESKSLLVIAFGGIAWLLFAATFGDFWRDIKPFVLQIKESVTSIDLAFDALIYVVLFFSGLVATFFYVRPLAAKQPDYHVFPSVGIALLILSVLAHTFFAREWLPHFFVVLFNLYIFASGIVLIYFGIKQISLLKVNLGFLLTAAIIVIRFYDSDISLLTRGVIFIVLGMALFWLNRFLVRNYFTENSTVAGEK